MAEKPGHSLRAGVFDTVTDAERAIAALRELGFTPEEISVICSDEAREQHFREYEHEQVGEKADKTMDVAGLGLLGLGGAAVVATLLSGGGALFILGAFSGLAAGGTFAALMASRGFGSEATDYYEQAVQRGKLLVTVHAAGDDAPRRLDEASRILAAAGADSFELPEG